MSCSIVFLTIKKKNKKNSCSHGPFKNRLGWGVGAEKGDLAQNPIIC